MKRFVVGLAGFLLAVFVVSSAIGYTFSPPQSSWFRLGLCPLRTTTVTLAFGGNYTFNTFHRQFGPDWFLTDLWSVGWPGGIAGVVYVRSPEPACLRKPWSETFGGFKE